MRQNAAFEFGEGAALVTGIDLRSAPSTFPKASGSIIGLAGRP